MPESLPLVLVLILVLGIAVGVFGLVEQRDRPDSTSQ
jgi:hypothetical protein